MAESDVAEDATPLEALISIARIARPQGIRGEVVADILTDFPERFTALDEVTLRRGDQLIGPLRLEQHRFHKGRVLLKFAGYDDADRAEELRGASLVIDRDDLVELGDDEYFVFDLEGCEVVTKDVQPLGVVAKVEDYGAAPLLLVRNQSREWLIPLTRDICPDVDIANKKIVVNPPDGLLDL